jgi:hypothetical protein
MSAIAGITVPDTAQALEVAEFFVIPRAMTAAIPVQISTSASW